MERNVDNSIKAGDKIHAIQTPAPGKGSSVKKKVKPAQIADTGVKVEINSGVRTGEDNRVQNFKSKTKQSITQGEIITAADVHAFVDAYNHLLETLGEDAQKLRVEVYKPVKLNEQGRQISLYEIGAAHSPNSHREGELSIDEATLNAALNNRSADVAALFLKDGDGLLQRLCSLVIDINDASGFLFVCAGIIAAKEKLYDY
jgi:flagellar capping protein FliD